MSILLVSAILYAIAFMSRGMEVTQVSVNDSVSRVTNQDRKLVGHLVTTPGCSRWQGVR